MSRLPIPADQLMPPIPLKPCQKVGCQHFAIGTIVLLVPYEGYRVPPKNRAPSSSPRDKEMEPMQLFLGIDLCKEHGAAARAAEFINPDMERAVIRAALEFHKPKPDFSRAIIGGRPLDDPQYIAYKAHREATARLAKPEGTA